MIELLVVSKSSFIKTDAALQLASVSVPSLDLRIAGQHVKVLLTSCLVEDWLWQMVHTLH